MRLPPGRKLWICCEGVQKRAASNMRRSHALRQTCTLFTVSVFVCVLVLVVCLCVFFFVCVCVCVCTHSNHPLESTLCVCVLRVPFLGLVEGIPKGNYSLRGSTMLSPVGAGGGGDSIVVFPIQGKINPLLEFQGSSPSPIPFCLGDHQALHAWGRAREKDCK